MSNKMLLKIPRMKIRSDTENKADHVCIKGVDWKIRVVFDEKVYACFPLHFLDRQTKFYQNNMWKYIFGIANLLRTSFSSYLLWYKATKR